MRSSVWISIGLVASVTVWMLSGSLESVVTPSQAAEQPLEPALMKVRVADLKAEDVIREVVVQGNLEPLRRVQLRAETEGLVVSLPVEKGAQVKSGQLLLTLKEDDRRAQLAKAEAAVASKRQQVEGMRQLKRQGLQAETQLKEAEANLATALAERRRIKIDLEHTQIHAPFDGVLESRSAELGTLLRKGDSVAEVVDQSLLKAVGYVPQQSAASLALGQKVLIRFLDGRRAEGRVTYIAPVAEAATRSFRLEAEVPNGKGQLRAGVSAELRIAVAEELAHFLSSAALTLNDLGQVGVKTVDEENTIHFYPVSMIRSEAKGIWVSGLPQQVRVLIQGQGFVSDGETVIPVMGG